MSTNPITVTVTVAEPMKSGDSFYTPFGVKTLSDVDAASGSYNKTVTSVRKVDSTVDSAHAQWLSDTCADASVAIATGQAQGTDLKTVSADDLAANVSVAVLSAALSKALTK